jgi:hypothetical protein
MKGTNAFLADVKYYHKFDSLFKKDSLRPT